ncbi:MAG: ATP-dependent Clp protease proteolytic subunit [Bacilli bacterium]|nr:ATP-dependent Clp protease proteolytic subunit [Bacilli bacterium]
MDKSFSEKLFRNRIITIEGEIDAGVASNVISSLLVLSESSSTAPIRIYIASVSHYYTDAMAIVDVIESLSNPIECYVIGAVGGYALAILASCTKGKRFMLKNSEIQFIQPLVVLKPRVQQTETLIEVEEAREERAALEAVLSEHTGKPLEEIQKAIDNNEILTGENAVAFGIVDKVI